MAFKQLILGLCISLIAPAALAGGADAGEEWSDAHMRSRYRSILADPLPRIEVRGADLYHQLATDPQPQPETHVQEQVGKYRQQPWKAGVVVGSQTHRSNRSVGSSTKASRRGNRPPGAKPSAAGGGSQARSRVRVRPAR